MIVGRVEEILHFSSNVVEKCVEFATTEERRVLIADIMIKSSARYTYVYDHECVFCLDLVQCDFIMRTIDGQGQFFR